ncbi:mRNA decay activator protein ZFP36L1-like isoform X2 [Polyodon spathula]|uniref:mRNA decay activator protein ZFP36L1-like isoform X2 n=1 Tax=Polyodon spathula TaxID=7913 RepID=UPI001B7E4E79|nr:mRNA decay activator protein ZFP36L1-like isoform X2 [Polyodon spathula]
MNSTSLVCPPLQNFRTVDLIDSVMHSVTQKKTQGFKRRHSTCPVTLPNSKFNSGSVDQLSELSGWPVQPQDSQLWSREKEQQLPRSCLSQIPFRVDRSVSMIESQVSNFGGPAQVTPPPLAPPPGLGCSTNSLPSKSPTSPAPAPTSSRYKTELCRTFDESGTCKYGTKCQFAHGMDEVRGLSRHPKYKTEPCRTFHTIGFCPYGARCHFIHNDEEQRPATATDTQQAKERPQLRQSISFAGFSTRSISGFQNLNKPLTFSRASSVSPPPSTGSPELLSPIFPEPKALKHSYTICGEVGKDQPATPRFCAVTDSNCAQSGHDKNGLHPPPSTHSHHRTAFTFLGLPLLHRSASADSLSDQEDYTSSSSLSGSESPSFEGRRLPIFSRISVSDD